MEVSAFSECFLLSLFFFLTHDLNLHKSCLCFSVLLSFSFYLSLFLPLPLNLFLPLSSFLSLFLSLSLLLSLSLALISFFLFIPDPSCVVCLLQNGSWAIQYTTKTTEGQKRYYKCIIAKNCGKGIYLLYKADDDGVAVFSSGSHDHNEIVSHSRCCSIHR